MKRTPWFSTHKHLPVRAGIYEWRCDWATDNRVRKATYSGTGKWSVPFEPVRPSRGCSACQWRGLTEKAEEQK